MFRFALTALGLLALSVPAATTAHADQPPETGYGFYLKLVGGTTTVDLSVSDMSSGMTKDEDSSGGSFGFGYRFNEMIKVEGFFADLGKAEIKGVTGNSFKYGGKTYTFTKDATIEGTGTGYGVATILRLPVGQHFGLFGKLGLHAWDSEIKVATATASANVESDGTDMVWGIGADYEMSKNFLMTLGYDVYTLDEDDVAMLYFGTEFLFD